ncbi:Lrp/AsnC family transcriptional regulator [Candidatus Nitrososphaera sp. FF02]|uniref:Lrp/AsnC family transcriptional regulator n=1 Tax=Candidatus Nitrososphaera sp. FF02 TaxID=3398226 RepID=UPI0039E8E2F9
MRKVLVLINTTLGSDGKVASQLREISGVTEVYRVQGVYDILAKVEGADPTKVKEIITAKLRKIDDIKSTITMVVTNDGLATALA